MSAANRQAVLDHIRHDHPEEYTELTDVSDAEFDDTVVELFGNDDVVLHLAGINKE